MEELQAGLWHWQAPHPDWTPQDHWPRVVSSYAIDTGTHLLLLDPLAVPDKLLRTGRPPVVVLTAPWHERDTRRVVAEFDAPVYTPSADTADDLYRKYGLTIDDMVRQFGVTPERAAAGSGDLDWLPDQNKQVYAAGDRLPFGIEVFPGRERNDVVLWIESHRAVVAGDSLVDFGSGLAIRPETLTRGVTREQVIEGLRPLLDLPVHLMLPAHGAPAGRGALERALAG
ncbi:MBL fold metallo-hydrolase [Paractinoplanes rishiriensis]|uniref:MBL fold metallo-hydrolase n=1 Tax=Paractinoplanes rishiriensis TaxID=1050105 RepID=A0A919N0N6_9ACTN|nr:MBL fold metallo-hydrolase [Actinoplanes rishiriensis]GIE95332.1 hypothetical protein Ari01nite_27970 [Actinoplanes rishiriensis]